LTLYSAADLLTAPGCPVCRYAAEASDRYLRWFALEGHAQPATITRLCTSLGACAAHTRRLMSQPGAAVRLTAVYRYVVTAARNQLAGRSAQQTACPACEHDDSAAQLALDTLLDDLADPPALALLQELGGLCLPHLTAAAARSRHAAALAETAQHTIAAPGSRCEWLAGTDHDAEGRALLRRAIPPARSPGLAACWPCLAAARAERDALARLPDEACDGPAPAQAMCAGNPRRCGDCGRPGRHAPAARLADAVPDDAAARTAGSLAAHLSPCARYRLCCLPRMPGRGAAQPARHAGHPAAGATGPALCVRHHLILRAAEPRTAQLLAGSAIRNADHLAAELAEVFDGLAWARSTGTSAPKSTAWQRAAAFLDGSVFSGQRQPPPADQLHQ